MGQDNTAVYQKLAMSLLDLLEDMKLQPIREDHRRLAALVHKLDEELHAMFAEERQSITASLAEHRQQLERLLVFMNANSSLPSPAWCEQMAERLRIVEGDTTHLKLLLHQNADKPNAVINGKPVRMGPPPGVPEVRSYVDSWRQSKDAISSAPSGVPAIVLARCAPHGKSDCPECGAYAVVDPTAQAYERIVNERDMLKTQHTICQASAEQAHVAMRKAQLDLEEQKHLNHKIANERDKLQRAFDRESNRLGEVLQLISRPDGHGSPYWSDPPECEPAEAVAAVLEHLRNGIVFEHSERVQAEKQLHEVTEQRNRYMAMEGKLANAEHDRDQARKQQEVTQEQLEKFVTALAEETVQRMKQRETTTQLSERVSHLDALLDAEAAKFKRRTEEFDTMVSERDRWQAKYNDEHGKRMSAEAKCTEFRGKAFDLEAQLARKDKLIETVQGEASRVPALREAIDGHTKTIERMNALCLTAQRWRESRRSMGASWADSVARNGADAGLVEAIDKFELDSQVAAGAVCDGDCPMVPGTYGEIAHRVGCPEHADPGTDVDDHPF